MAAPVVPPDPPAPHAADFVQPEHIYLEADDGQSDSPPPKTVARRIVLNNPAQRIRTELTLFEEGWIEVRERRSQRGPSVHRLDLRYLDPTPTVLRHVAWRTLYAAAGLAAACVAAVALAQWPALGGAALWAAAATGVAALATLAVFVYRTRERTVFHTTHGRAAVLTLTATFSGFRRCRAILPALARAIRRAQQRNPSDKARYLRAEMREHYRLQQAGVIGAQVCTESTRRILNEFG